MNKSAPGHSDSLDPREASEVSHAPVFPEGSAHPTPTETEIPHAAETHDEHARGAQGRYGVAEEPEENSAPIPEVPKTADQLARDRDRDKEVRETGEDLR